MSGRSLLTPPPTVRIPSPGPGKGCRQTIRSGRPSSAPTARTSSLNSIRSGSTSLNLRASGRPPPLWGGLTRRGWGAADVVVGLDRRGMVGAAGLDHVGVERALDEEVDALELLRLLLEDADELAADDLALGPRFVLPGP